MGKLYMFLCAAKHIKDHCLRKIDKKEKGGYFYKIESP